MALAAETMILGPVSYLDCVVFCALSAPQLIWHAGLLETVLCALGALPFLLVRLPVVFFYNRYIRRCDERSSFVKEATPFEDFVVRCVRYAFTHVPPRIGCVFFSGAVARPFLRFRMLRHGYLWSPINWTEYGEVSYVRSRTFICPPALVVLGLTEVVLDDKQETFRGIWLVRDPTQKPDFVLYYVHGGGFAMGSCYFYLEFLMAWLSLLILSGYENPAIFALEYTLVPNASYPTQINEVISGYKHVVDMTRDPSIVCVSGDSAGALLVLSLLLHLSGKRPDGGDPERRRLPKPGLATLISPWVTLMSQKDRNTESDYLDVGQLQRYGRQFAGSRISEHDPLVSPGCCKDISWWKRASPVKGIFITYGEEEVLAPEIKELIRLLGEAGVSIRSKGEPGGIHAWPVAALFLSDTEDKRLKGLRTMTQEIRKQIPGIDVESDAR